MCLVGPYYTEVVSWNVCKIAHTSLLPVFQCFNISADLKRRRFVIARRIQLWLQTLCGCVLVYYYRRHHHDICCIVLKLCLM